MPQDLRCADELLECVHAGSTNLLLGVKAVSQLLNPEVDLAWVDSQLLDLAGKVRTRGESVDTLLKTFHDEGFLGLAADEFHEYSNSDIEQVLRTRRGLPITYVAMIIGVCDHLSLPSHGVNFPGVFLAQVDDRIINPIDFSVLDYDAFTTDLRKKDISVPDHPELASNADILKRMFNNLQEVASVKGDVVRRLEFVDYMQLIEPNDWYSHFKRAETWVSMGDYSAAKAELEIARDLLDDESAIAMIDQNLKRLTIGSDDDQVMH